MTLRHSFFKRDLEGISIKAWELFRLDLKRTLESKPATLLMMALMAIAQLKQSMVGLLMRYRLPVTILLTPILLNALKTVVSWQSLIETPCTHPALRVIPITPLKCSAIG